MSNFNKYLFLDGLKATIIDAIKSGEITDISDVWEFQNQEIETACIYYSDCFDICKELNFTDWTNNEFGEITNITQAAYVALQEFINDEFCAADIEELIEELA
jgi:hypothetical protein